MDPYVTYEGRDRDGTVWTVRFRLHADAADPKPCYFDFDAGPVVGEAVDVDAPSFWGYAAYLGAKFIENGQFSDEASGRLFSPVDEAVERAAGSTTGMVEPEVGAVCWRFGSPPYPDAQPTDHVWLPGT